MIKNINKFIEVIKNDLSKWPTNTKPWFRGESGENQPLCPKIASFNHNEENYLLQSFRRHVQFGGLT